MQSDVANQLLRKVDSLPTLPSVATRVLELTLADETTSDDLGQLLARDPALTTKILKVVNSAAFGLRYEVTSLGYAITILGMQRIRTLVLSLSIMDTFAKMGGKGQLDSMGFWRHSVAAAAAAKSIATKIGGNNPEEAYVAALIHDLGILLLDSLIPAKYGKALIELQSGSAESILEIERKHTQTDHAEIGCALAQRWKLPKSLIASIEHHHRPENAQSETELSTQRLVALTATADYLAWCAGYPSIHTVAPPPPSIAVLDILNKLDLQEEYENIHENVRHGSEIFRYDDPKGERLEHALLRANAELGRITAELELANRGLTNLNTALLKVQNRLGEGNPIESLLAEVVGTLGYERSFLLTHVESSKYQVVKVMSGDGGGTEWEGQEVDVGLRSSDFKGTEVRLNASLEKPELLSLFESKEMIVAPIFEQRNISYLLAADRGHTKQEIPQDIEKALGQLTIQAGLLLENYRLYQKVQDMAITDPLTGVCNRRRLMQIISEEVDRAKRTKRPIAVSILDIDHFKQINDKLGHLTGDQVLKGIGELLRVTIRQGDYVGRYGGEEFLIVLPGADREKAGMAAERMRKAIESFGQRSNEMLKGQGLTASFGVASLCPDKETFEGFLARADEALYQAKEGGRNCVVVSPPIDEAEK